MLSMARTSTIAKNRHLNTVLQAELYLRTGTDRPKNTLAIDAPGAVALHVIENGWTNLKSF